jgi:hypothetical protein
MGKGWAKNNYCDIIPDVFLGVNLKQACYEHDLHYWHKDVSRKEADIQFRINIISLGIPTTIAWIMYFFLRAFGWIKY